MKVQAIYYTSTNNKTKNYTRPSFQSWHIGLSKTNSVRAQQQFYNTCYDISNRINLPASRIIELVKDTKRTRIDFLKKLVSQYNHQNYYIKESLRENPENVLAIFNLITKPSSVHSAIISKHSGSFEQLGQIFSHAKGKEDLQFVQNLQHGILPASEKTPDVIIELLQSPNSRLYAENLGEYTSYLKLNSEDANVVKNLDEIVSAGKFDRSRYDAEYAVKKLMNYKSISKYLSDFTSDLNEYYSPDRVHFLKKLCQDFLIHKDYGEQVTGREIIDMYKSVTHENFQARRNLLEIFKYHNNTKAADKGYSEFSDLKILFDRMDSDAEVMKFVTKSINGDLKIDSVSELIEILNTVPTQKANIFFNNLRRIVRKSDGEERTNALVNELENPFYESEKFSYVHKQDLKYGFAKPESKFSKLKRYIENQINIYKYSKLGETEITPITAKSEHVVNFTTAHPSEITEITLDSNKQATALHLTNKVQLSPHARKLIVINDVNDLIRSRLGQKTLERQEEIYAQNATKMRLKLLPEIFESIKDTRKVKKSSADNRDAIRLYQRIKGNNRKLIRYMLLKQNTDGTRMFSVRDIINYIDKANIQIEKNKKLNSNYRAADAKAYYEELFQNMVQENGKLKISRKKKAA